MSLYTAENPVFASFSFYAALLGEYLWKTNKEWIGQLFKFVMSGVKTLMMAFLTARQRFAKRVSAGLIPQ